jgi:hypothetical protein
LVCDTLVRLIATSYDKVFSAYDRGSPDREALSISSPVSRRNFTKAALAGAAAATAGTAARAGRVLGANDRVRLGCIGIGNRGVQRPIQTRSDSEGYRERSAARR